MRKAAILLIMTLTLTLSAQKTQKPTGQQIINMVKVGLKKHIDKSHQIMGIPLLSGIGNTPRFKEVKINNLQLTKIGKAQSNYYEEGGSYISSYFFVKVLVEGSAVLKETLCFGISDYNIERSKKCNNKRYLSGEIPFRNVEHRFIVTTDEYGDWYAKYSGIANEKDDIDEYEFIKKMYDKKHSKKPKKVVEKDDFLQKLINEGKRKDKIIAKGKEKRKNLILEMETLLTKKDDLKEIARIKAKCIKEEWWCGGDIFNFEYFYLSLVKIEKEHHIKLVKQKNKKNTSLQQHEKDMKLLNGFFEKHPDIKKQFYSGYINPSYLGEFSTYITIQKTKEASYLVFLELSKHLMSIKKN